MEHIYIVYDTIDRAVVYDTIDIEDAQTMREFFATTYGETPGRYRVYKALTDWDGDFWAKVENSLAADGN